MWKKRRREFHIPALPDDEIFSEIGIEDANKKEIILEKFKFLYEYWLGPKHDRQNRSELGRTMSWFLPRCILSSVKLALFADQLDYFKKAIIEQEKLPKAKDRPKLYYLFTFACILGSRQVGEWLIEKLKMDLPSLQGEQRDNLFAYTQTT